MMFKNKSLKKTDYPNTIPKNSKHLKLNKHDSKVKYLFSHGFILYEFIRLNKFNHAKAYKRFDELKENKNYKWDYSINKKSGYFDIFRAKIKSRELKGGIL